MGNRFRLNIRVKIICIGFVCSFFSFCNDTEIRDEGYLLVDSMHDGAYSWMMIFDSSNYSVRMCMNIDTMKRAGDTFIKDYRSFLKSNAAKIDINKGQLFLLTLSPQQDFLRVVNQNDLVRATELELKILVDIAHSSKEELVLIVR